MFLVFNFLCPCSKLSWVSITCSTFPLHNISENRTYSFLNCLYFLYDNLYIIQWIHSDSCLETWPEIKIWIFHRRRLARISPSRCFNITRCRRATRSTSTRSGAISSPQYSIDASASASSRGPWTNQRYRAYRPGSWGWPRSRWDLIVYMDSIDGSLWNCCDGEKKVMLWIH